MAVPDETRRSLDRDADGFCRAFESPAPVLSKTSEAPVVAVHDDGTVDVGYGGAVLTVRMTTACAGVAVGDTVLLTAYGQMLYATGVLARDNGHYVGQLTDKITLTVQGRLAVVSADFLDITKVNTITKVAELPSWCVPVDLPGSIEWIGYLFTRGGQSYGQIMIIGQDVMAYASNTGAYHSGQVVFHIERPAPHGSG